MKESRDIGGSGAIQTGALSAAEAVRVVLSANERDDEVVSVLVTGGTQAGERVVVASDGALTGTLGSPELDRAAVACAHSAFAARAPVLAGDLFAELHTNAERLLIFGAGHIAVPLAELAVNLGFAVTVLDDRAEFAHEARFAPGVRVQRLAGAQLPDDVAIDAHSYVVLVTRAHQHDFDLLRALLVRDAQPRYIGMIGSRRRVRAAFTALLAGGVPRNLLASVRAPVGLDIGAETPAEIAVSIAAELVAVRRGAAVRTLSGEERVLERFF